jgi:uncharacterized membrane protein
MQTKNLTSQITFIIALIGTVIAAYLFSLFPWNKQHPIYLGVIQFFVAIVTLVGIFAALKYKPQQLKFIRRNRFFLWGNVVLLILLMYTLNLIYFQ